MMADVSSYDSKLDESEGLEDWIQESELWITLSARGRDREPTKVVENQDKALAKWPREWRDARRWAMRTYIADGGGASSVLLAMRAAKASKKARMQNHRGWVVFGPEIGRRGR